MTRPTTSSMIAALINTVPMRDCWKEVAAGSVVSEVDETACCTGDGERVVGREQSIALLFGVAGPSDPLSEAELESLVTLFSAARVVPRLVEESAAPAAKASSGL